MRTTSPNKLRGKSAYHGKDPADGSGLSLSQRLKLAEELCALAGKLSPFSRYKPFVKTFNSLVDYEKWRKKQKNPWLI